MGYRIVANNTGITISTKKQDSLTLNEAIEIIYNAMNIGYPQFIGAGQ